MKRSAKPSFSTAKQEKGLQTQLAALHRVLWAVIYQQGGEFTISEECLSKAHMVTGHFDTNLNHDGSFYIAAKVDKDFTVKDELVPDGVVEE